MIKSIGMCLFSLMLINGCMTLNDKHSCHSKQFIQCKSLTEVNKLIDENIHSNNQKQTQTKTSKNIEKRNVAIFFAGYSDKEGYFHEAHKIHMFY